MWLGTEMKTESEFSDVYLDFIRKHGIHSALRRDNAKSEMSQCIRQIYQDLIIADQWTETHVIGRIQQN